MNITDAFTEAAIEEADTNVEGKEEEQLRAVVQQIFMNNEINWSPDIINVAVLCFVAGRTYQADQEIPNIAVTMSPELVSEFLAFLVQKGSHD